ncbi:hypothetical protein L6164_022541 [Bauhinia variegata]|uniref:Uncharacterized protein n=1 Tax=Bauhinia variegata TaxID=167791 RepID=A0ACB9MGF6_BAUVA|nr:hypothetical protein L6164_022541 [Bauhinia variegata]
MFHGDGELTARYITPSFTRPNLFPAPSPSTLEFSSTFFSILASPQTHLQTQKKMAAWAAAARQASNLARLSSPKSASGAHATSLVQRRGMAGGGDHHGPSKVNIWEDPLSPSKWKEEHFVIVSLAGWGAFIYGGYKFFTRGNGKKEEKVGEAPQKA